MSTVNTQLPTLMPDYMYYMDIKLYIYILQNINTSII